jgi:hypothetical protein
MYGNNCYVLEMIYRNDNKLSYKLDRFETLEDASKVMNTIANFCSDVNASSCIIDVSDKFVG